MIVSFINIHLQGAAMPVEKHVGKENRVVLKEQKISRTMEVLLLGYLENPQIKCMRQLVNKATG
jgi:hypothetical protein